MAAIVMTLIDAGDGNDTIYDRRGNDTVNAGDGDDAITYVAKDNLEIWSLEMVMPLQIPLMVKKALDTLSILSIPSEFTEAAEIDILEFNLFLSDLGNIDINEATGAEFSFDFSKGQCTSY